MQTRKLNYRFSYGFDPTTHQNISSNYYPIQSAIAMRSDVKNGSSTKKPIQVTVMNERSQGGSAGLQKGMIEMCHNRRTLKDDNRGVAEPLNETDSKGYGMKVNSRYWLQIFNLERDISYQRALQNDIDQPLQLIFSRLDGKEVMLSKDEKPVSEEPRVAHWKESISDQHNYTLYGKTVLWPWGRNKIMVRLENIADMFDMWTAAEYSVDMQKFAEGFWNMANPSATWDSSKQSVVIEEMDLTLNMLQKEVISKKRKWKGQDDDLIEERIKASPELKAIYERNQLDDPITAITMKPQDIRTFLITYGVKEEVDAFL